LSDCKDFLYIFLVLVFHLKCLALWILYLILNMVGLWNEKLVNRCDRKEICLLDLFCQFHVIVSTLIHVGKLFLHFFLSGGTEHQNYSMEQDSMTKELIFGKKEKKIVYTTLLCFNQTCSHGLSSSCSQAVF